MPTKRISILSHPCRNGLRLLRPRRLFGVDGTAGGDPCSPAGLVSQWGLGLPPATAPATIADVVEGKLQGGPCEAWGRGRVVRRRRKRPPEPAPQRDAGHDIPAVANVPRHSPTRAVTKLLTP